MAQANTQMMSDRGSYASADRTIRVPDVAAKAVAAIPRPIISFSRLQIDRPPTAKRYA